MATTYLLLLATHDLLLTTYDLLTTRFTTYYLRRTTCHLPLTNLLLCHSLAHEVRFEGRRSAATRMLFVTEGVLLRMLSSDDALRQYDAIVLDEVLHYLLRRALLGPY